MKNIRAVMEAIETPYLLLDEILLDILEHCEEAIEDEEQVRLDFISEIDTLITHLQKLKQELT